MSKKWTDQGKDSSNLMGLNDNAWEGLFDKYNILDKIAHQGQFAISAAQIKEFREPRLMTKFDHKINLPEIFAENRLAILPTAYFTFVSIGLRMRCTTILCAL